jgi:hypothetical protein
MRSTVTGPDGFFTAPFLSPGAYEIRASLPGFRTAVRDRVDVFVNETVRADFVLEVGEVTEHVTVLHETPLVETRSATRGIVIDQRAVVDLPLNGRNFTQLGTLIPGVIAPPLSLGGQTGNATPGGIVNATGGFNVNGMRNQSNNFLLDGAPNNDSFNTGFVIRPPPDAIQEFKILSHAYTAEFGRSAGSIVNVVTRSGSNRWSGTLWEFNRHDRLQAKNHFAKSKPTLRQNQFGGAVGGPLRRNRLFLFSYFEGFRNREGQTDTRAVPSGAQRNGDFSGDPVIRAPTTGQAFGGNVIPPERLDPIARRILNDYVPLPNDPDNLAVRSPDIDDTRGQVGLRMDARLTDQHTVLSRYIVGCTRNENPLGATNFAPIPNISTAMLEDLMGSHTWVLGNTRINVVRVSLNRIDAKPTISSGLDPRTLGFAFSGHAVSTGLPFITLQGFFTTGDAQGHFVTRENNVWSVADDFVSVVGPHSLKFGGEIRRDRIKATYIFDPNGEFIFTGQYSGSTIADFVLGFPSLFRVTTGDPSLDGSSWTYAVYAQDEYRPTPRVTLNYGVRYEVSTPYAEARDR